MSSRICFAEWGLSKRQGTISMVTTYKASIVIAATMLSLSSIVRAGDCQFSALLHQHRDAATIETLEFEWTRAFLRGDTGFEECLLTPDFTEIMRNGEVKHLSDELALAAKNAAHPLPMGEMPKGTVLGGTCTVRRHCPCPNRRNDSCNVKGCTDTEGVSIKLWCRLARRESVRRVGHARLTRRCRASTRM